MAHSLPAFPQLPPQVEDLSLPYPLRPRNLDRSPLPPLPQLRAPEEDYCPEEVSSSSCSSWWSGSSSSGSSYDPLDDLSGYLRVRDGL
jgi:hypothetical protein